MATWHSSFFPYQTHHLSTSLPSLLIFIHYALRLHHHSLKYIRHQRKDGVQCLYCFYAISIEIYVIRSILAVCYHHTLHLPISTQSFVHITPIIINIYTLCTQITSSPYEIYITSLLWSSNWIYVIGSIF